MLLILAGLSFFLSGFYAGIPNTAAPDEPQPVRLSRSLFYNPDSIAHYTAIAAREDDPRALFIAGMATRLSLADPDYPFSSSPIHAGTEGGLPSPSEADYYLLRAAELGYPDAVTYIRCLAAHNQWSHYLPANCR